MYVRPEKQVVSESQCNSMVIFTSLTDVAKLGDGLARPSILLLLLYGLGPVGTPMIDWRPRMLPRLRVIKRSGCCPRMLRLRMRPPGLKDDVDGLVPTELVRGWSIC
jgi:hypothetical protein